ncbi:hypothetical protein NQZ68_015021 [Dissostichus eleginoides]|nr:hypothetical protein NQZ68_015021 [Dissostichus eleginoides]
MTYKLSSILISVFCFRCGLTTNCGAEGSITKAAFEINVASLITKMRPLFIILTFGAVASSGVLLATVLYFVLSTTVT